MNTRQKALRLLEILRTTRLIKKHDNTVIDTDTISFDIRKTYDNQTLVSYWFKYKGSDKALLLSFTDDEEYVEEIGGSTFINAGYNRIVTGPLRFRLESRKERLAAIIAAI